MPLVTSIVCPSGRLNDFPTITPDPRGVTICMALFLEPLAVGLLDASITQSKHDNVLTRVDLQYGQYANVLYISVTQFLRRNCCGSGSGWVRSLSGECHRPGSDRGRGGGVGLMVSGPERRLKEDHSDGRVKTDRGQGRGRVTLG